MRQNRTAIRREILADLLKTFPILRPAFAAWHPDSGRISVWATYMQPGPGFWTAPAEGGAPVRSDVAPEVLRRIRDADLTLGKFVWAPAGDTLYFIGVSRGVTNLWKIDVDPRTLRWIGGPERLTTGPGEDSDIAVSRDGRKIAFTVRSQQTRVWVLPFDSASGRVQGKGKAETPAGMDSWAMLLSVDGSNLAYIARRPGREELRQRTLADGTDRLLAGADQFTRSYPAWSRDGKFLAYKRNGLPVPENERGWSSIVVMAEGGGEEQVITTRGIADGPKCFFSDNRRMLAVTRRPEGRLMKLWLVSRDFAPHAEDHAQFLTSDPDANFYQPQLSTDEHWICFLKVKADQTGLSKLETMPAAGGEMAEITDGRYFDDKPQWSPDGKTIYFLSSRGGFFNVWGIRFDPVHGKAVGEPFRVTAFESPNRMATPPNQTSEMSVSANHLALPITELSGSIWVLENVR